MTRHAKKTHASLYEAGQVASGKSSQVRTRYVSTPGQVTHGRPQRTQRKERSISDPGPMRVPDVKQAHDTSDTAETKNKPIGLPRNVIVHHSSTRGTTEPEAEVNENTVTR